MAVDLLRRTGRDLNDLQRRLGGWMRSHGALEGVLVVERARPAEGAGTANETVLAECRTTRGTRGIVVRLTVPEAAAYLDPDLERQAAALRWVAAHTAVPVAAVYGVDPTGDVLGAPFLVTERVAGSVPPDYPNYNTAGPLHDLTADARRALWQDALDQMCRLHRADVSTVDFLEPGPEPLVRYWERMAEWVGERAPLGPLAGVRDWVRAHFPADAPAGLSWGDARLGNMLFAGTRCTAGAGLGDGLARRPDGRPRLVADVRPQPQHRRRRRPPARARDATRRSTAGGQAPACRSWTCAGTRCSPCTSSHCCGPGRSPTAPAPGCRSPATTTPAASAGCWTGSTRVWRTPRELHPRGPPPAPPRR